MSAPANGNFLRRLWETQNGSDLRIVPSCGETFFVHKLVVCEQSKYLAERFARQAESKTNVDQIDVEERDEILEQILRHLYGLDLTFLERRLDNMDIWDLLQAASLYGLPRLSTQIGAAVLKKIASSDLSDVVELAVHVFNDKAAAFVALPQSVADALLKRTAASILSVVADKDLFKLLQSSQYLLTAVIKTLAEGTNKDTQSQGVEGTGPLISGPPAQKTKAQPKRTAKNKKLEGEA